MWIRIRPDPVIMYSTYVLTLIAPAGVHKLQYTTFLNCIFLNKLFVQRN